MDLQSQLPAVDGRNDDVSEHRCTHSGCSYRSKKRYRIVNHVRGVHEKIKRFACPHVGCEYMAATSHEVTKHCKVHSSPDQACPFLGCIYKARHRHTLQRHVLRVHEKSSGFACAFSGCAFRSSLPADLTLHVKSVHSHCAPRFACDHQGCSYESKWRSVVKRHQMQVHLKLMQHACHVCSHSCCSSSDMRRHLRSHERRGHKVSECSDCQRLFQDKRLLSSRASPESVTEKVEQVLDQVTECVTEEVVCSHDDVVSVSGHRLLLESSANVRPDPIGHV